MFASSLSQKARQLDWTADELRRWLLAQGYTERDIQAAFSRSALRAIVQPTVSHLLPKAAAVLGWPTDRLARRISLKVVNADDVDCHVHLNAWAYGKHKLRLFAGFLFFANKVVRALANGLLVGVAPPIPRAEEDVALLLRAFYGGVPLPGAWAITPYRLTSQQEHVIAFLSGFVREAAIAHELGHIVFALGHRSGPLLTLKEALTVLQNPKWGETWLEEIAADFLALKLLQQPSGGELASAHGLMVLLFIIEMLERCGTAPMPTPGTHPPASARRGFLFQFYPWLGNASALATVDATCRTIVRLAHC